MTPADLLTDAFERILSVATAAVDGLSDDQLTARPTPDANSIAWLVWHLARVQDGDAPRDPVAFARRVAQALAGSLAA